jgi:hypothetical protein
MKIHLQIDRFKKVFKEQLELKDNSTFSILKSESDKSGSIMKIPIIPPRCKSRICHLLSILKWKNNFYEW